MDDGTATMIWAALEHLNVLEADLRTLRERLQLLVPADASGLPFVVQGSVDMDTLERLYVEHTLRYVGGNKTRAAEVLGVDASTLHRKLVRWGTSPTAVGTQT